MARYIDADSLYSRVKTHTNPYGKPTLDYESGVKVLEMINQEPTADVIPKEFLTRKEDEAYERGYAEGKSEVAREIFEEIYSCVMDRYWIGGVLTYEVDANKLDKLKKEYTE